MKRALYKFGILIIVIITFVNYENVRSFIARYPVRRTAQSISSPDRPVHSNTI